MKNNLYTSEGWVNTSLLINSPSPLVIAIGGRGIGKTYGCLKDLYNTGKEFIYLRRTQTQIDNISIPALNPFNALAPEGINVTVRKNGKYIVDFYRNFPNEEGELIPENTPFSIGVALSTFSNIRGISSNADYVLFDEIIPERSERKNLIKEEGECFLNLIESLNRNKEIQGLPPMKFILLSNSNTINSQILSALNLIDVLDTMERKGKNRTTVKNGLIEIFKYSDSPISEKKKTTFLYNVASKESDFYNMSVENRFSSADREYVKSEPLKEYNPVIAVNGVTVYSHKTEQKYYIVEGEKTQKKFDATPLEIKSFRRAYYYLYKAMLTRRITYSSVKVKILFERLWE